MTEEGLDAFSEAILEKVAELAYAEMKPHLRAYYAHQRRSSSTAKPQAAPAPGAGVVSLEARRARRVA
jgi:hypothetical protein